MLSGVTPFIRKVSERQGLTAKETESAFNTIAVRDKEGYYFLAILLALHTKGETSDELLGICRSFARYSQKVKPRVDADIITDTSGTGGDRLKTLNVSTTAAFVLAGKGVVVAKKAFFAITGLTGSADIFASFGIDVMSIDAQTLKRTLEKVGISPYLSSSPAMSKKESTFATLMRAQIARGLKLITPLHLAANVDVAVPMRRRVYGCAWEDKLDVLAELFQKMGYVRGMVVHGLDGIDEVSTIGKTRIVEYTNKRTKTYTITPDDMGIKKAKFRDIKAISKERNVIDFLRILYGKDQGPRRDVVLANAAASLYVLGKAKNLALGVKLASESIDEGLASNKLEQLVEVVGNKERFKEWKEKAGLISS